MDVPADNPLKEGDVIGAGGFTAGELRRNIENTFSSEPGKEIPCRRCGTSWVPGTWNFHDLCPACFAEFDRQKMVGRGNNIYRIFHPDDPNPPPRPAYYSESCEQWMKGFPLDFNEPGAGI